MKSIDTSLMSSLCEGLVGYATYESRAGLGAAMSEVVFYMPALRIAKHLEWESRVEFGLPNLEQKSGDKSLVDFAFARETKTAGRHGLVIEMKWEPKKVIQEFAKMVERTEEDGSFRADLLAAVEKIKQLK